LRCLSAWLSGVADRDVVAGMWRLFFFFVLSRLMMFFGRIELWTDDGYDCGF
jgi:hypothetical protein